MQDLLEIFSIAYKKLSAENIVLFLLLIKIFFCALGGLIVTYSHSLFSYKWLRNNFNLYVGVTLPIIGLVITTVIGSNIALSIGMIIGYGAALLLILAGKSEIRALKNKNRFLSDELNELRNASIDEDIYDEDSGDSQD